MPTQRSCVRRKASEKNDARYRCSACGTPLFGSEAKFDAGTGFPSFRAPISAGRVALRERRSHGVHRLQVCCAACGAHLGHRFDDDAQPTGRRYCINAGALDFDSAGASSA